MRLHLYRTCSAIALLCSPLGAPLLCGQTKLDLRTQTKSVDFSGAAATKPAQMGSTLPASCGQGQFFFLSSAPAGQNVYGCSAANIWSLEGSAVALASLVPAELNKAGSLLTTDGTNPVWQSIGGDITGTPAALRVGALLGRGLSTAAPADGQLIEFNGATGQWTPLAIGGDTTGSPAALKVGALLGRALSTLVPADGQLLQFNGTTGQWTPLALAGDISGKPSALVVGALQGRAVATTAPADGQLLKFNASAAQWQPVALGGDVTGAPSTLTVSGLQGRAVSSAAATAGQLLSWNSGSNAWTPSTLQIPPNYSAAFSGVTTMTIAGTQHNLNTSNLTVECYDNASPANLVEPGHVTIDPATFNVTVAFAQAQTGRCVVNGSGGVGVTAGLIAAGAGIAVASNGSITTISTNTAAVPMYFTGAATLAFPAIANGACAAELTIAVANAQAGDGVAEGWPALPAGLFGMMRVSAAGIVAVRLCNLSGSALTPASLTYRATVVGTPN